MDNLTNYSRLNHSSQLDILNCKETRCVLFKSLCRAFNDNKCSLNSPLFTLDQTEFNKTLSTINHYRSTLENSESICFNIECGESSGSFLESHEAASERLVCHVHSKTGKILGKIVIGEPEKRFFLYKMGVERDSDFLKNMQQFSNATIKDRYKIPHKYTKLENVLCNGLKFNIFGVVTAVNKIPTKTRSFWHSFLCISDPTMINQSNDNEELPPGEFKLHLFLPFLRDHPEIHRGDVIKCTNVKIESHENRHDGRIFEKDDLTVFCHWDYCVPVPNTNKVESNVIQVLGKWWKLNSQYFDYLTPRPINQLHYKYPGVRLLQETTDQLICNIYCQVVGLSDDSQDVNFMMVRDGTIFTLEQRRKSLDVNAEDKSEEKSSNYGYLALLVFDAVNWKHLKTMNIGINDYVFLREVKVLFVSTDLFDALGSSYAFRYPCILLHIHSGNVSGAVKKIPAHHHEAIKIRSRLHRLPDILHEMKTWRLPLVASDESDRLCDRLADPCIQIHLLKRMKRI